MSCSNLSKWFCSSRYGFILFALLFTHASFSFELLTENAMDSVSVASANSGSQLLNVAGSPAAGIVVDGYDALPYQSAASRRATLPPVDDVDGALVDGVEVWADQLRGRLGSGFEVGYVDELPESAGSPTLGDVVGLPPEQEEAEPEDDNTEVGQELSRIDGDLAGEVEIVFPTDTALTRVFERAVSIDIDPLDYSRNAGDAFVSDSAAGGSQSLTAIREEFKPLF